MALASVHFYRLSVHHSALDELDLVGETGDVNRAGVGLLSQLQGGTMRH